MNSIKLKSPAKVNLFLDVETPAQKNGFHRIFSLFGKIDLCDEIILKKDEKISLKVLSPWKIPHGEENLAYRAGILLKKLTGCGAKIILKKRIPPGSGLGGGSSNAASVLKGMKKLWNLKISDKKILEIALKCGSDVPFFLEETTFALVKGRGEIVKPVSFRLNAFVVLWFGRPLSTQWVYRELDKIVKTHRISFNWKKNLFKNVLEIPAFKIRPYLFLKKRKMIEAGARFCLLSGSGATLFGIFKDFKTARKFLEKNPACKLAKFL